MLKNEELLTYEELAEKVKMSVGTLRNLKLEGMPFVLVGKHPRFYLSEVLEYFNQDKKEAK